MRIYFVGYMGSGKTTIGRRLAKDMGLTFVDVDNSIVENYSMSIAGIFETEGESRFREIERDMLHRLSENDNALIATGGGAPCFYDNMEFMNTHGVTVYLKFSPQYLVLRLAHGADKRPLIRNKSPKELEAFITDALVERSPYYEMAEITIEGDSLSDDQILIQIKDKLTEFPQF